MAKNRGLKILSLFDGISCARVALDRAGHRVSHYYSSEIDAYAMQISGTNYFDVMQIGDVRGISSVGGRAWQDVDLLIGGSPCQDLSIAKRNRQGLDGARSGLFWHYVRILKEIKPKYFILENVASMSQASMQVITDTLGVEPIMINAALVSAQQRKRLFWTNIPGVKLPVDREIFLKDIIHEARGEKFDLEKYIIKGNHLEWITDKKRLDKKYAQINGDKALAMLARQYASWNGQYICVRVGQIGKGGQGDRIYSVDGKSVALSALGGGRGAKTGLYLITGVANRTRNGKKQIEVNKIGKANAMTSVQGDSMCLVLQKGRGKNQGGLKALNGKTPTLSSSSWEHNNHLLTNSYVRKLTPTECCRLQGLPDNYVRGVSDTQGYKAVGNAFNVDVVAHILSFIKK